MHGRRALAAAAAAGLLISLFAPWYRESVVARGLTGLRTMTLTRSGWDAFSFTEALVLVVAALVLVLVAVVAVGDRDGGRGRPRLAGAIVAALGAIAFLVVLIRLVSAAGTTRHELAATMVSVRWGIFLALGCSAVLTAAGLRLLRVAGADPADSARRRQPARRDRASRPGRTDPPRRSASGRAPRAAGPPRAARVAPRSDRVAPRPERLRPSAPRADARAPSPSPSPSPARRRERPRPARRADRPRWEDQATGWLDLPDSLGD
jgi:hypothetical protein